MTLVNSENKNISLCYSWSCCWYNTMTHWVPFFFKQTMLKVWQEENKGTWTEQRYDQLFCMIPEMFTFKYAIFSVISNEHVPTDR